MIENDLDSISHTQTSGSLQGCIQHLTVNTEILGFPDILSSWMIQPGCVWQFGCTGLLNCLEVGEGEGGDGSNMVSDYWYTDNISTHFFLPIGNIKPD